MNSARNSERIPFSLQDVVGFLSTPEAYSARVRTVSVLQTSHAWLFRTERHVYKLKKPLRRGGFDFSTLAARHDLCRAEYRLNRRLARNTYLDVVPLGVNDAGQLELGAEEHPVEWLVKMRRLPESRTLLGLAATAADIDTLVAPLMSKLIRFYRRAPVQHFPQGDYVAMLHAGLSKWRHELLNARNPLPRGLVDGTIGRQSEYIDRQAALLEGRRSEGRIREVHGDLRPEHIFFPQPGEPEIIDCLEFDARLRRLDCVEEIAFLGMECRHAGYANIERACRAFYTANSDDRDVPPRLWDFYAALRATTRAGLCVWHRTEADDSAGSSDRAIAYLRLARRYIERAADDS